MHVPSDETRAFVRKRTVWQTQEGIAKALHIDVKTLCRHYREELNRGIDEANDEVANSIMLAASGRELQNDGTVKRIPVNPTLAIWWSKTRMGWKEPPREADAGGGEGGATIVIRGGIAAVHHEPSDESA